MHGLPSATGSTVKGTADGRGLKAHGNDAAKGGKPERAETSIHGRFAKDIAYVGAMEELERREAAIRGMISGRRAGDRG